MMTFLSSLNSVSMSSWFLLFLMVQQAENFLVPSSKMSSRSVSLSLYANSPGNSDNAVVNSVKNLRPVVSGSTLYRSATLDELTEEDAERLLSGAAFENNIDTPRGKPLASVIDLRNIDEIRKGQSVRTKGSQLFYDSPDVDFITIPILGDINAFWEETISTMDSRERIMSILQTVMISGALDRAAARHLERGGLSLLMRVMMTTGSNQLALALDACRRASVSSDGGPVIFHCQKGKDRTGVLAMLLQTCLQKNNICDKDLDGEILGAYTLSGELLGEFPNQSEHSDNASSSTSTIDWSYFRGSPTEAMQDTLSWVRKQYGSVEGYLDSISFDEKKRNELRKYCLR